MSSLFDTSGFLPHGYCLSLRPGVIWLHVVSDGLVALAYLIIPITLVYFVRRMRYPLSFSRAALLFAAFIVLCGLGHAIEIVTFWKPIYYLQGLEKAATAIVSMLTAFAIIPLVPKLLAMRTPEELENANHQLRQSVAAREAAEKSLRFKVNELNKALKDLEHFAYFASHDLQAPLRSISGFSELLRKRHDVNLDTEGREFLDFIQRGTEQMERLIKDLLALSRIGSHATRFKPQPLIAALKKAESALADPLRQSGARLEYGELPEVVADHGLLAQLFQNLIANSIKFQPPGGKPLIRLSARRDGEDWHLVLKDNGIGIPEKDLESIFAAFHRLRPDEYEGTGIGLSICGRIVEHHGGRIWAAPCRDGAEFHVRLPVNPQQIPATGLLEAPLEAPA